MPVATDLARIVGRMVRRADNGLAARAASNAAHSMNATQFRRLEDARTLRDLEQIPAAVPAAADVPGRAVRAGR